MAAATWLQYISWAYLTGPKEDRELLRSIRAVRGCKIVELGMFDTLRAVRMVRTAQRFSPGGVHYTACDLFDARPQTDEPLKLIDAHRELRNLGAKVNLLPGLAEQVLPKTANALTDTDLLVISAEHMKSMSDSWFYVPRMLSDKAVVLREVETPGGDIRFAKLTRNWIQQQVQQASGGKRKKRSAA